MMVNTAIMILDQFDCGEDSHYEKPLEEDIANSGLKI